jgi:hypothetical protein
MIRHTVTVGMPSDRRVWRWSFHSGLYGLSAAMLAISVSGCGTDQLEQGTEATVTVAGEPVVDVRVNVFAMQDGKPVEVGFAVSRAGGKLKFLQPQASGPLVLESGDYRFTAETMGAELVIPQEYTDPATTPLQATLPSPDGIILTLPEPKQRRR